MDRKNKSILVSFTCVILALLMAAIAIGVLLVKNNNDKAQYKELLSLGDKYLEEEDFENAILNYTKAINIDRRSEEGYLQLADVYVTYGDYEGAMTVLDDCEENVGAASQTLVKRRQEVETLSGNPFSAEAAVTPETSEAPEEVDVQELFYTYIRTDLSLQRGLSDISTVQQTITGPSNMTNWLTPSGLLSASIYDFDKDGQDELLVLYYDAYNEGSTMENAQNYAIYASVYEAEGAKVTQAWDGLVGYTAGEYYDNITCPANQSTEHNVYIDLVDDGSTVRIMVADYVTQNLFADGVHAGAWSMQYSQGVLYTDVAFAQTAGGSSGFEYTGFVLNSAGQIVSQELLYAYENPSGSAYQNTGSALNAFFESQGIAVNGANFDQKMDLWDGQSGVTRIYDETITVLDRNYSGRQMTGVMQRVMNDATDLRSHLG